MDRVTKDVDYLQSLSAVRQRSAEVYELAKQGKLDNWSLHEDKYVNIVAYCSDLMKHSHGDDFKNIPPHTRWRHFSTKNHPRMIDEMVETWTTVSGTEQAKRLIDLMVVSVLLDAGAGGAWTYKTATGEMVNRSEGLAVASFEMFNTGIFSSNASCPQQADATALSLLTTEHLAVGFQVNASNRMVGLEGRTRLLQGLGTMLKRFPLIFGSDARPGNMLAEQPTGVVSVKEFWTLLMKTFGQIWPPGRTVVDGVPLGDAWSVSALAKHKKESENSSAAIVPFHKLTQWLAYSILDVMERVMKWRIVGYHELTGLPEYRNGGLLVDFGLLRLRSGRLLSSGEVPSFAVSSQTVIEWRALTVVAIDRIVESLRQQLSAPLLTTAQVLEAATWKAGRAIAAAKRVGGGPPLDVISDGTVF